MKIKNKKVVVTGSDGFIGSHLVEELLDAGAKVRAFCYYNSFNSYGWLEELPARQLSKVDIFMGDIRDYNGVYRSLKGADMVFHLAALIGIPYSYHAPANYVDTNINGTLNVLQAARELKLERVLVTSTSEVYGTARYVPIDEKHPLQAQSPYSASKIGADRIAEAFYRSFGIPVTVVRPFNTYGPRQSARAVIPTIIGQLLNGAGRIKLGNLEPRRDFTYVKDTCSGFLALACSDKTIGEEINIASGDDISIGELAELLIEIVSPKHKVKIVSEGMRLRPEKSEVMRLLGSNRKLKELTGWKQEYPLGKGLRETVSWMKQNIKKYKTDIYNV